MKKLIYLIIFTSFLYPDTFAIDLGIGQLSLFRILTAFLCLIFVLWFDKQQLRVLTKDYSSVFMILWFIYAVITIFWARDYVEAARQIFLLAFSVAFVVILQHYLRTPDDIVMAFRVMELVVLALCLLGFHEAFTGDYLFFKHLTRLEAYKELRTVLGLHYPVGMSYNINDYATIMLFGFSIGFANWQTREKRAWGILDIMAMGSCAFLLVLTQSRANMLGLAMMVALLVIISRPARRLFIPVAMLLVVFGGPVLIIKLGAMTQIKWDQVLSTEGVGSDGMRINLIRNSLVFLRETYGFGTGAGQSVWWMANRAVYNTSGTLDMHNWWMEILTDYGVIVFVGYMVFYLRLFLRMIRGLLRCDGREEKGISAAIAALMTGFVIGSISSSSNMGMAYQGVFWGVAVAWERYLNRRKDSPEDLLPALTRNGKPIAMPDISAQGQAFSQWEVCVND